MSSTPFPGPYPTTIGHILVHHITTPVQSHRERAAAKTIRTIRRRPTLSQGHALETLGHAIEYLVDSGLRANRSQASAKAETEIEAETEAKTDTEAQQIMMRLSREVFAGCREVAPASGLRSCLQSWLQRLSAPHSE